MREYTNSDMTRVINEYIHSKKHRKILLMCFIDGISHEEIASDKEVNLTPRQVSNIISKSAIIIDEHLSKIS